MISKPVLITPTPVFFNTYCPATHVEGRPGVRSRRPAGLSEFRRRTKSGKWTDDEHRLFLEAIELYGNVWKNVETYVGTRSCAQIRSHSQKYFQRLRTKTLEELRRTNQLKNKVFLIIKEYRNYTGSLPGGSGSGETPINSVAQSPAIMPLRGQHAMSTLGTSTARPSPTTPSQTACHYPIPPLLIESRDERPGTGETPAEPGRFQPEDLGGTEGLKRHMEELKIEMMVEEPRPDSELFLGKLHAFEDGVPEAFPSGGELGAMEADSDFAQYGRKRQHCEKDRPLDSLDYSSVFMRVNYES